MSLSPWIWRSIPLQKRTGSDVFAALFLSDEIAVLLESPYPTSPDYPQLGRFSICAGQPRANQVWTPAIGEILPFLNQLIAQPSTSKAPEHLPFTGGWLGWLGYDLAWEIERLPYLKEDSLPFPVAFWYEPECFAVLDHEQQILWLAASDKSQLNQLEKRLSDVVQATGGSSAFQTQFCMEQADYEAIVLKAKQHIRAGDIFQANLSLRFEARTQSESWAIYRSLQSINPSPFASYWKTPCGDVISCSPERLVKLENGIAQTRPIAGTRPRGTTPEHDRQLTQELLDNTKEQAEHIMLVDLERNDLGRVCEWGTVQVDELLVVEHYSHVMHLVSNVIGKVRSEFDSIDVIRALFPGGTITGCPKVRCMEIVETLEPVRRSLFYGSCGYLDRRGNLDLNILIRTLLYAKDGDLAIVWGQVGAGIVADSDPEREWFESLQKARAQLAALGQQS
ncbi:anthranilate synthase component I [Leptolyngbya sp. NIES-2104]|uniref:anthranilate synthase component I n=1 Tax=Leptolyngbya sp. NIES-2104 TaxID=1552121 RepID=UPI00073EA7A7|nr:anthranilate synthase component I [Leptolyngbya sp. NIES-2104]